MKKCAVLILLLLLCLAAAACGRETNGQDSLYVAGEGTTQYTVVYPTRSTSTHKALCTQFAQELERRTGAAFPVQSDREAASGPVIVIGQTDAEAAVALLEAIDTAGGGRFGIRVSGENIFVAGTGIWQTGLGLDYLLENCVAGDGTMTVPRELDHISSEIQALGGNDLQSLIDKGQGIRFAPAGTVMELPGITKYSTVQGVCTDGTYVYVTYCRNVRAERTTPETALVQKFDLKTGELAAQSELLELNHANDISYDPTRELLLVSCAKGEGNWYEGKRCAYVDPQTLELVEYREADTVMRTLQYLTELDCYVGAGDDQFFLLDREFKTTFRFDCQDPNYSRQSLCSDGQYIYDVRYAGREATEHPMVVYGLDGTYMGTFPVCELTGSEPESLFLLDGEYYLACNFSNVLVRLELLPQVWWPVPAEA